MGNFAHPILKRRPTIVLSGSVSTSNLPSYADLGNTDASSHSLGTAGRRRRSTRGDCWWSMAALSMTQMLTTTTFHTGYRCPHLATAVEVAVAVVGWGVALPARRLLTALSTIWCSRTLSARTTRSLHQASDNSIKLKVLHSLWRCFCLLCFGF